MGSAMLRGPHPKPPGARASLLLAVWGRLPGSPARALLTRVTGAQVRCEQRFRSTPGAAPHPRNEQCSPTACQEGGQTFWVETRWSVGCGESATSPLPLSLAFGDIVWGQAGGSRGLAR